MAVKNRDTLPFDTMRLEGALFVPDLLEKISRGEHRRQQAADYQVPKGLKLHDEYGRAFQIAQAQWKTFASALTRQDVDVVSASLNFVREFLHDALGYGDLREVEKVDIGGRGYPAQLMVCGRVPVIVAPGTLSLDDPDPRFAVEGSGSRKKSAFRLAQELLNASDESTWALVANGRQLRFLRDAATLTRPSFLEFDLETIFTEARYPDFAALWRILHASRAGRPGTSGEACIWEEWREEGKAEGTRVREGLRHGVTQALIALGEGFLQHPSNDGLRRALHEGDLSKDGFFQELLRLVYRCLFLFTLEERELLHPEDNRPEALVARAVYAEGYSMKRLRRRVLRLSGSERHDDLWQGLRIVFRSLHLGEPRLALPALGGLFALEQCPAIDRCNLFNQQLLAAIRSLRWAMIGGDFSFIDYRHMGPEELGSVYESLLELVPVVDLAARRFTFIGLGEEAAAAGHARKTTGSYYTPDSLVQELIKSALDPVIEARLAARPNNPTEALLSITVIDPACGSGHFLLAAARRLAERLTELRAVDGSVRLADFYHCLRQVIGNCIFGVDKNFMALELARTALWLEGYEPGLPLSFLDHHLVCGDALLGLTDLKQMEQGIPDAAYKPLSGDDKSLCRELARANREGRKILKVRRKQMSLFAPTALDTLLADRKNLDAMPDTTPEEVTAKEAAHLRFLQHASANHLGHAADLFVGVFLLPKKEGMNVDAMPTSRDLAGELSGDHASAVHPHPAIEEASRRARMLHWPLVFPEVFAKGGFDCILANPPWERIKLQEEEFFASRHPDIAAALNKAERGQRIAWLGEGMLARNLHPEMEFDTRECEAEQRLYAEFITARRTAEATSLYAHVNGDEGGRYPHTGVGDVNTYALFAETISQLVSRDGRAGFIVPTGIATDDSTKAYFADIAQSGRLISLFSFENEEFIFPSVHHSYRFCLLTIGGDGEKHDSTFAFFARQPSQIHDERRQFTIHPEEFLLINPNTRTCPVFRSQMDAELTRKIYTRVPVMIREAGDHGPEENPWGIRFMRMLDMANDSHLFALEAGDDHLPLYEAKMIHQFDHRWASYQKGEDGKITAEDVSLAVKTPDFSVQPRYWVAKRQVLARIARVPRAVAQGYAGGDGGGLLAALANWVEACYEEIVTLKTPKQSRGELLTLAGSHFEVLPADPTSWRDERIKVEARNYPPLTEEELYLLRQPGDLWQAADALLDGRSPRWLMGWRDITSAHVFRTVIASVLPRVATGDTLLLMFPDPAHGKRLGLLLADQCALVHDFSARQKVGGTHLKYHVKKQLPILSPDAYTATDLSFIIPRVLELTYTSHDLKPWAEVLGYNGPPFPFDPERRAHLRAELDAYYARLYGLNRDELRYILDPAEVMGADYPSETFRVLKNNELREFGEYRTRRLVLEAWDRLDIQLSPMIESRPIPEIPTGVPLAELTFIYPATKTDRTICALALALVQQSGGLTSMDHLDALLLATHPELCQIFLDPQEHRAFKAAKRSCITFATGDNQSIHWKECRDYLEKCQAISVKHGPGEQPIAAGPDLASVLSSLPQNVQAIALYALKALTRIKELRKVPSQANREQEKALPFFERQHQLNRLAA